jgi:hypothetical protein
MFLWAGPTGQSEVRGQPMPELSLLPGQLQPSPYHPSRHQQLHSPQFLDLDTMGILNEIVLLLGAISASWDV